MIRIEALEAYLRQWIAKKSIATRNYLILQEINKLTKVDLKDYKGIKTALNVTLDPAFGCSKHYYKPRWIQLLRSIRR